MNGKNISINARDNVKLYVALREKAYKHIIHKYNKNSKLTAKR